MTAKHADFLDADAGQVLVTVVCGECGGRPLGVVQSRWTVPAPEGGSAQPEAPQFRYRSGRNAVGSTSLAIPFARRRLWCRKHGFMHIRGDELMVSVEHSLDSDTPRVCAVRRQRRTLP